jgi:hypothetical protein
MGKVTVYPMAGPGHPIYTGELFIGTRITGQAPHPKNEREAPKKKVREPAPADVKEKKK